MAGPGNMDGPWHMSSPVNTAGPGNTDGPGRMPHPGNMGSPLQISGSGIMSVPRDLPGSLNISGPGNMPCQGTMPDARNPGGPGGGNISQWSSPRPQDHPSGWSPRDPSLPNPFNKTQPLSQQHPNPLQSPRVFASRFESVGDQQKFQAAASAGPRFGEPHFAPGQSVTTNESQRFMNPSIDQRLPSIFQQNDVKAFVPRPEAPHFTEVLGRLLCSPWLNQAAGILQNCRLTPGTPFNLNRNESRTQLLQTISSSPSDPQFFRPRMIPNSPNIPSSPIAPGANAGIRPEFCNTPFTRNPSNETTQTNFAYTTNHNRSEDRQNQFRQNEFGSQGGGLVRNVEKQEQYSASNLNDVD